MRKTIVIALAATVLLGLGGCDLSGKVSEPFKDAPRGHTYDGPADVITMPDGFNNIASKCDGHGHRVYSTYHNDSPYGSLAAVADPSCN